MTDKHTPGPWEYNDPKKFKQGCGKFSEVAIYAPGNAFPWRMAEVSGPDDETAIANAAFIVRACNAHDALVEALKRAVNFLPGADNEHAGGCRCTVCGARAALSLAEEAGK